MKKQTELEMKSKVQITESKSFEQLKREHEEHSGRAKEIADKARENFKRPAYGKVTHIVPVRRYRGTGK